MNENGVTAEEDDDAAEAAADLAEEQVKIVVIFKGDKASVGIQKPDCDPFFALIEGDLGTVFGSLNGLVDQALHAWATGQKYPKCEANLAPPPPPRTAAPPAARAPAAPKAQPAMF